MISQREINLFFPLSEHEDAEDKWEEMFFENKKHFLQFAPVPKVFGARLKKLRKSFECYLSLIGEDFVEKEALQIIPEAFSENVLDAFNDYQNRRIQNKQKLLLANDFYTLSQVLHTWFSEEKAYYALWCGFEDLEVEALMGKEPDPMYIISAIKEWNGNEKKTFVDLRKDKLVLPEILQKGAKRLNLLHNSNS